MLIYNLNIINAVDHIDQKKKKTPLKHVIIPTDAEKAFCNIQHPTLKVIQEKNFF